MSRPSEKARDVAASLWPLLPADLIWPFARAIDAFAADAVREEREACADLCSPSRFEGHPSTNLEALRIVQDAIHARGAK